MYTVKKMETMDGLSQKVDTESLGSHTQNFSNSSQPSQSRSVETALCVHAGAASI